MYLLKKFKDEYELEELEEKSTRHFIPSQSFALAGVKQPFVITVNTNSVSSTISVLKASNWKLKWTSIELVKGTEWSLRRTQSHFYYKPKPEFSQN